MIVKFPNIRITSINLELNSLKITSIALNAFLVISFLILQGCAVYTVASTATKTVAKTAGLAVDVATAPVRMVVGGDDDDADDEDED